MTLKETFENYITAQEKHKKTKYELGLAETRLEMQCRKIKNSSLPVDKELRMLAHILVGKLQ